jgi:hypothetical protein
MTKKFEKIMLTLATETYWPAGDYRTKEVSALDALLPIMEKHSVEVSVIDWEHHGEFEFKEITESEETTHE